MAQKNKTSVGPVCTCAACGNYNPRFGNHCDALRIAFADSEKCWAKMSREKRMDIETAIAAVASNRHSYVLDRKIIYWAGHPIEGEDEEK